MPRRRPLRTLLRSAPAKSIALGSALTLALAGAAAAQESSSNPIKAAFSALGFVRAKPDDMPAFVKRTRPPPDQLHYIPLGSPRPQPAGRPLTRAQIKAEEAALTGLRDRDLRRAGLKPPTVKVNSAAGERYVPRKKSAPHCRITCRINLTKVGN